MAIYECRYLHPSDIQGINIGAISIGNTYTMPHSPDLSLSLSYEYEGIKTIETKGGASLSNAFYTKAAKWGGLGAWELVKYPPDGTNPAFSRSGRRVWDLSFSYLSGSDVFGANQNVGDNFGAFNAYRPIYQGGGADWDQHGYEADDIYHPDDYGLGFNDNILTDDSIFSQVIHKTNGGQLPFIFQPDSLNRNPDGYAIAKLDMSSFSFKLVANGVYNMKLKIREVW